MLQASMRMFMTNNELDIASLTKVDSVCDRDQLHRPRPITLPEDSQGVQSPHVKALPYKNLSTFMSLMRIPQLCAPDFLYCVGAVS